MSSPSSSRLQKGSQEHGSFSRAAVGYQVMRFVRARVQPFYCFALARLRLVHQKETCDRPNGIKFGLAVNRCSNSVETSRCAMMLHRVSVEKFVTGTMCSGF